MPEVANYPWDLENDSDSQPLVSDEDIAKIWEAITEEDLSPEESVEILAELTDRLVQTATDLKDIIELLDASDVLGENEENILLEALKTLDAYTGLATRTALEIISDTADNA